MEAYTNIEEAYQQWKSLFNDGCDKHCPIVSRRVTKTFIPWIDAEIKEEIRLKHIENPEYKENVKRRGDILSTLVSFFLEKQNLHPKA